MTVSTIPEWHQLPRLDAPTIKSTGERGARHRVLKVGFLRVSPALAQAFGIDFPALPGTDHVILPTALVQEGNASTLYRLPLDLGAWAADNVAIAMANKKSLFPATIELAHFDGRSVIDFI